MLYIESLGKPGIAMEAPFDRRWLHMRYFRKSTGVEYRHGNGVAYIIKERYKSLIVQAAYSESTISISAGTSNPII
jgi:hypothetical protein